MNYLYLLLDLGSLSIPLIFSFHPKLRLYQSWKFIGIALALSMVFFIPWDIIFTSKGFWGFNDTYFSGYKLFYLPLEEWLFFICIPYACIFTYYALLYYFPDMGFSKQTTKFISLILIVLLTLISILYYDRWYTLVVSLYGVFLTLLTFRLNQALLSKYYLIFLVILIPFFLVNGILTGSYIQDEIVWYNNDENMGIRLFTIPLEDTIYAFTLILTNLLLIEYLQERSKKKSFGKQGVHQ